MKNPAAPDVTYVRTGQFRWDPLEYIDNGKTTDEREAAKMALADRNKWVRLHRQAHPDIDVTPWTLRDQLRKYSSFGNYDGRIRSVYYVTVSDNRPRVS